MYIMIELFDNLVILKIGYTHNIIDRYKSLCNDYRLNNVSKLYEYIIN